MKFHHSVMLLMTLLMLVLHVSCDPGHPYRRLPFNGSMYGKRAASILPSNYDSNRKSLSSFCELAIQVCSAWLPQQAQNN